MVKVAEVEGDKQGKEEPLRCVEAAQRKQETSKRCRILVAASSRGVLDSVEGAARVAMDSVEEEDTTLQNVLQHKVDIAAGVVEAAGAVDMDESSVLEDDDVVDAVVAV